MKENKICGDTMDAGGRLTKVEKVTMLKKKANVWQKRASIAVCIVLILGMGLLVFKGVYGNQGSKPILKVSYPKAYAFDDYDTWREISEQNPVDDSLIEALSDFSYKTGSIILTNAGKNINYSPLSLYYALSLAAIGAKNETEAQLLDLLGISDAQTLSEQCGNLYRILYRDNKIGKLKIANSIWMDNDMNGKPIVFSKDFVKQAAKNFYASSYSVDFANAQTAKAMANWISANTNGTLSPSFETGRDQILAILNTVYFYDQWINKFNKSKTAEDVFYLSDGGNVKCDFMNQTFSSAGFARGNGFIRAGLGLKNASQMLFILPDEGISPYELLSSPEQMRETFEGGEGFCGEVVWKIPKFNFSSKLELTDALKKLGISSAFTKDADFSGITSHQPVFITDVRQETHISIDENGVEASSFTQVNYSGSALPEGRADMILNRPFIYGIVAQNGSLLFVGVCENPAE